MPMRDFHRHKVDGQDDTITQPSIPDSISVGTSIGTAARSSDRRSNYNSEKMSAQHALRHNYHSGSISRSSLKCQPRAGDEDDPLLNRIRQQASREQSVTDTSTHGQKNRSQSKSASETEF